MDLYQHLLDTGLIRVLRFADCTFWWVRREEADRLIQAGLAREAPLTKEEHADRI